jgi:hypothetical protein
MLLEQINTKNVAIFFTMEWQEIINSCLKACRRSYYGSPKGTIIK